MTRVVVVGNGMVGSRFVEDLLAWTTPGLVTVLGAEHCEPYNRVLLSEVVAGRYELLLAHLPTPTTRASPSGAAPRPAPWTGRTGRRRGGRGRATATTCSSSRPGLRPACRHWRGCPPTLRCSPAVHAARSTTPARSSRRPSPSDGGGARCRCPRSRGGLRAGGTGVAVTVVHPAPALMERQLDGDASRVVEAAMTIIASTTASVSAR